jgi:hypothetical protein
MSWIRIRIKVISWIRIRINLQMTSQNVWDMSLFEPIFKVLSLYLEARIRFRIRIKVKGRSRIRIHIKVTCRIRIRINLQMTSQKVWNMSLFEPFLKVLSLYLEARIVSGSKSK